MKTSQLTIYLSLFICFLLNTSMVSSNTAISLDENIQTQKTSIKPSKSKKKRFKKLRKFKKKFIQRLRKITSVEDGPTMLLAIAAVILGGILVYYFFQLGFLFGLLAVVGVSYILYLLFRYLNY